ncbi:MAG: hypothetical protein RR056_00155 [Acetivibrio sp.]
MKKKFLWVLAFSLVLIGLIFFAVKEYRADDRYEGVLVEAQPMEGKWYQV